MHPLNDSGDGLASCRAGRRRLGLDRAERCLDVGRELPFRMATGPPGLNGSDRGVDMRCRSRG
jgi:hypothetical protein